MGVNRIVKRDPSSIVPLVLLVATGGLLAAGGCGGAPDEAGGGTGETEAAAETADRTGTGGPTAGGTELPPGGLEAWISDIREGLRGLPGAVGRDPAAAERSVTGLYLNRQEHIERYYGPGGSLGGGEDLAEAVREAEARFHDLMRLVGSSPPPDSAAVAEAVGRLEAQLDVVLERARAADVPLTPPASEAGGGSPTAEGRDPGNAPPRLDADQVDPRNPTVAAIVRDLREAEAAWATGDRGRAQERILHAYLEGFETLEPRLAGPTVRRAERLFHLELRPLVSRGAPDAEVEAAFSALYGEMAAADEALASGNGFWFGAFNAFMIILREGLEAALLIAAILAYLTRVSDDPRHRRQVYAGLGLGIAASLGTWVVARTLIPVGGGSRELIEGVTALLAVGVLVYVSHWLFHKTYVHDWKEYLTERVGRAISTGSALAMALLAFAAVYREGFETVLFYQALLFDVGGEALLAGFLPGLALIVGMGVAIVRVGVRLPLKKVFAITNAVLLYLAFTFLGKGLYNLQEAGLFSPHPAPWVPDHEALRQLLGLYPVAETVLAQAGFLLLLAGTYAFYRLRSREKVVEPSTVKAEGREGAARRSAAAGGDTAAPGRPGSREARRKATGVAGMTPAAQEK